MMGIVESVMQWFWSADPRALQSTYADQKLRIGTLFLPAPELLTLGFAALATAAAWYVMRRTDIGKALRASAEDAPVAAAFGVNERRNGFLLAGTCAGLTGVAGVCIALTESIGPAQMYSWVGVVFAAVMLGGLGSPIGPLVAGIVIGISEAVTMAVTSPSWAPLVSFTLLILILLVRPGPTR
jgi:branched-chain amino acid transport system permease protein